MDLVFKSPMDTIWIDIYCCPDVQMWLRECYKMMEVVVSEQSISPDSAGVWHLSIDISSVWVYSVKYSARWVENVFFPTLNYKYILHQH